jgi:hypothetical protein
MLYLITAVYKFTYIFVVYQMTVSATQNDWMTASNEPATVWKNVTVA